MQLPTLALALLTTAAAPVLLPAPGNGPQVGSVAPEPGLRSWVQADRKEGLTLEALRGRVVLLHTFAWNCTSCRKVGIPLVVDLLEAAEDRGLSVLSITTPAFPEETKKVIEGFGMRHAVAVEQPFGSPNPYVDAMANPVTYVFVIGRNGDVVWRGDPSTELDECVDAVARALDQRAERGLERRLHAELQEVVGLYFAGEWSQALKLAEKLEHRHGRRSKGDSPTIAADAQALRERIAGLADGLLVELEKALDAQDAEGVVRVRHEITTLLPKSAWLERAEIQLTRLDEDDALSDAVVEAESWRRLAAERPALFPVRTDKASTKFVKALRRFVERNSEHPQRARAEAWIASWKGARKAK
jgi:hypothetical protein